MLRFAFSLPFLFWCLFASGQNPARSGGKDYAVFFYVTDFQNGWERLPETKEEVKKIADELQANYGFDIEVIGNPTKKQIEDKITEVNGKGFGANDQTLFFFSMHGYYDPDAERGYLVPADGKTLRQGEDAWKSWFSYDELSTYLAKNKCGHILVALDACYSGSFGNRWKGAPGDLPWENDEISASDCHAKISNVLAYSSRNYFTSGSDKERTPAQSLFASRWLEALRRGKETGVVRVNDLRYYLSSIEYPQPEGGSFSKKHEAGGDFVFVHNEACLNSNLKNNDENHWLQISSNSDEELILKHLQLYPNCPHLNKALQILKGNPPNSGNKTNTSSVNNNTMAQIDAQKFRYVKGGTFRMGSGINLSNETLHDVIVKDFYIGLCEITFEEYDAYCEAISIPNVNDKGWGREKRPVMNVSWYDAVGYCNWRSEKEGLQKAYTFLDSKVVCDWNTNGYRLPSEAEWEFAARSRGKDENFAGTSNGVDLYLFGNYYEFGKSNKDGYKNTAPVASFKANELGLFDMSGNVSEWCWDWSGDYPATLENNPRGPEFGSSKITRGGNFGALSPALTCSHRDSEAPDYRSEKIGFRLVRSNP